MSNFKKVEIEKGVTVVYKSIPPLAPAAIQTNYEKQNPKPVKPTYIFEAVGGVKIEQEHDETTISTPEEKQAYEKYLNDNREWQTGLTFRLMNLFLLEGIELEVSDKKQKEWNEKLKLYGFSGEFESETEKQLTYLQTFIFKDKDAVSNATQIIMSLTGVSQEDIEAAEKLF